MKRVTALLLAISMMLSLAACGEKEPEGPPEPTEWVISTEYITQRMQELISIEVKEILVGDSHCFEVFSALQKQLCIYFREYMALYINSHRYPPSTQIGKI